MNYLKLESWENTLIDNLGVPGPKGGWNPGCNIYLWCTQWCNIFNLLNANGESGYASVKLGKLDLQSYSLEVELESEIQMVIITKDEYSECLPLIFGFDIFINDHNDMNIRIEHTSSYLLSFEKYSDPYVWKSVTTSDLDISNKDQFLEELTICYMEYVNWLYENVISNT